MGGSYIGLPNWLKIKKTTVSPKDENNKFKYAVTVSLHHQEIPNNCVNNIGPFTKMYDCKEINFPSDQKDLGKFERKNPNLASKIVFLNEKEIEKSGR